jgi:hypothetical protein
VENDNSRQNRTQAAKTRLRERVIAALLVSPTMEKAATSCGLSVRTVQRMLNDPEFAKEYQETKVLLLRDTTAKLTSNSNKAVETLRKIFNDRKAPHSARVTAAVQTVRLAREGFYLESLEERIRKLEEQSDAD